MRPLREEVTVPRILLVEDNEMNRDMLSRRLVRRGYQVDCAVDGEEGVKRAREGPPDLILMDMSLPVLDGWMATRALKDDPVTRKVPVVALTAHAMAGDRDKALEAGADDYDTKPIDFTRLLGKIEALLARKEPA
jgi:two-component system cell cycle response regulator DivK